MARITVCESNACANCNDKNYTDVIFIMPPFCVKNSSTDCAPRQFSVIVHRDGRFFLQFILLFRNWSYKSVTFGKNLVRQIILNLANISVKPAVMVFLVHFYLSAR